MAVYLKNFEGLKIIFDDCIDDKELNSNKFRKFYYLLQCANPPTNIVSYGGLQSNALAALSKISKMKNINFHYFAIENKRIINQKEGNLKTALDNGSKLHMEGVCGTTSDIARLARDFSIEHNFTFIGQGGDLEAMEGYRLLAIDIQNLLPNNAKIFLSAGSGISSYFLALNLQKLKSDIKILAYPCVGDSSYLYHQYYCILTKFLMRQNLKFTKAKLSLKRPKILRNLIIINHKKSFFGKLDLKIYEIYKFYLDRGVEFDLLYDASMMANIGHLIDDRSYILHSGGLNGNQTQIKRYKYKYGKALAKI